MPIVTNPSEEATSTTKAAQSPLLIDDAEISVLFVPLTDGEVTRRVSALGALSGVLGAAGNSSSTSNVLEEMDNERVAQIVEGHFSKEQ